jgi:sodium--glutamate symport carrier gltS
MFGFRRDLLWVDSHAHAHAWMANMAVLSKRYCAAHKAFMIVPRECGFFVDLANAVIIRSFLNWFASV